MRLVCENRTSFKRRSSMLNFAKSALSFLVIPLLFCLIYTKPYFELNVSSILSWVIDIQVPSFEVAVKAHAG